MKLFNSAPGPLRFPADWFRTPAESSALTLKPMRTVHLTPDLARLCRPVSPSLFNVPSMMTAHELQLLYGLAESYHTGAGVIVDAGIFLGASTRAFGDGLVRNRRLRSILSRHPRPIVSFDRAIVNPGMVRFFEQHGLSRSSEDPSSFLELLTQNIAAIRHLVDLRIGDFQETVVSLDEDVEILFLDILKSPQMGRTAVLHLFPRLIPGRSIVIQQDYFIDKLPFIKTDQEAFGGYFDYLGEIGPSAVFRCKARILPDSPEFIQVSRGLPADEQVRLAGIALQRSLDPDRRFLMALSKVRLLRQVRGPAAASTYLAGVCDDFPVQAAAEPSGRIGEALLSVRTLLARHTAR